MPNIFHKDHGFVNTSDQDLINELLAKGAELVDKCSEYEDANKPVIEFVIAGTVLEKQEEIKPPQIAKEQKKHKRKADKIFSDNDNSAKPAMTMITMGVF